MMESLLEEIKILTILDTMTSSGDLQYTVRENRVLNNRVRT